MFILWPQFPHQHNGGRGGVNEPGGLLQLCCSKCGCTEQVLGGQPLSVPKYTPAANGVCANSSRKPGEARKLVPK